VYIDIDGKRRKIYAFSIILGYSRMRYVEFTTDISTEKFIAMHLNLKCFSHNRTKMKRKGG
jgi:transposase